MGTGMRLSAGLDSGRRPIRQQDCRPCHNDNHDITARASGKKTAELQTDSGASRGCTPDKASRLPDRNRADYRGWGKHAEGAGWTFLGRRWELCPGQVEASSGKRDKDMEEVERYGILFNFCQSRREEDDSQTGSKL
ncbi:hypothetical protein EPR50_G00102240 [Perca flavescens]|uniref:Uncharacterized protein n=1 Tax=Perca flavescens TaxID=8167 RepID=A0A484D0Z3_PERFV|nr:hypothetical protein EPR50_G00102240 [Perca flavescens]